MALPSPDIRPGLNPRIELGSLAPDIPEGLEKLGGFNIYAIDVAPDGLNCSVQKLEKIDKEKTGYRVTDTAKFTPQTLAASRAWTDQAFLSLFGSKDAARYLTHPLGLIDEITKEVSDHMERAREQGLSS